MSCRYHFETHLDHPIEIAYNIIVMQFFQDDPSFSYQGAIVRFSPDETALACLAAESDADKWCAVESGTVDYLRITPSESGTGGTFEWVSDKNDANPELYAGSEGAHVENGIFTFSTIVDRYLFQLDLAAGTYTRSAVPFSFEPDNLRLLGDVVYLCSDGDDNPGDAVWRWDDKGASRVFYEVCNISLSKAKRFSLGLHQDMLTYTRFFP